MRNLPASAAIFGKISKEISNSFSNDPQGCARGGRLRWLLVLARFGRPFPLPCGGFLRRRSHAFLNSTVVGAGGSANSPDHTRRIQVLLPMDVVLILGVGVPARGASILSWKRRNPSDLRS